MIVGVAALLCLQEDCLTEGEYLEWAAEHSLSRELASVLFEVCHVRLGLRAKDRRDEARVIG